jgi:hypothetical protein
MPRQDGDYTYKTSYYFQQNKPACTNDQIRDFLKIGVNMGLVDKDDATRLWYELAGDEKRAMHE